MTEDETETAILSVLLPIPTARCYSYRATAPAPKPGSILRVPFGRQSRLGVVWDDAAGDAPGGRLKAIEAALDLPPVDAERRRFIDWVAGWTLSPRGAVLRMALPEAIATLPPRTEMLWEAGGPAPARRTKARAHVLETARASGPLSAAALAKQAGVSDGVVRGLIGEGCLLPVEARQPAPARQPDPDWPGPVLDRRQADAAAAFKADLNGGAFAPSLLYGVTGSGKTEVYFEAIAEALRREGGQILVLLPEIALTGQWLERFERRFGAPPLAWHSDLGMGGRRRAWHAIGAGSARVVVGARSALFLPFTKLALIIVDEEHDPSFKQEEGVLYNARDMAVVRASIGNIPVILASATPSLETLVNADAGRYRRHDLDSRHGGAALPAIAAIDLRRTPPEPGNWIAPPLAQAIGERLARGEQSLLFLNRRGYAPLTLCRSCGARLECPHCTAWLVEHRARRRVECHHCGYGMQTPDHCPACKAADSLVPCGPGVERLAEEVLRRWPAARVAVATSDSMKTAGDARALIGRIESGALDIVIGTQIITKGYHFPSLTLIGVIDADLGLRGGDLRAGERTFQQLVQVSGRAGRAEKPGEAFLQTYDPGHPVTEALLAGDEAMFYERERAERRRASMPPFGRLAAIILSGRNEAEVARAGRMLAAAAPRDPEITVFGPAPAPLSKLRGRHRHRLLAHGRTPRPLQTFIAAWLDAVRLPPSVRLRVDIDPYSFM